MSRAFIIIQQLGTLLALMLFCACSDLPDDVDVILEKNRYARQFDEIWQALNSEYIFFEEANVDFDELRVTYIKKMSKVYKDKQFVRVLQDFCEELGEQDIRFQLGSNHSFYAARPAATNDIIAKRSGLSYYSRYYRSLQEEYVTKRPCSFNTLIRIDGNGSGKPYGLMLVEEYVYELSASLDTCLREFASSDLCGVVLDIRGQSYFPSAQDFLPYFYERGKHTVCKNAQRLLPNSHSSFTPYVNYNIEGNGVLTRLPIAIIVNEATGGELSWMAHILSERSNVAIISRAYGGRGSHHKWQYYNDNKDVVTYPGFRSTTKHGVCYEPLQPDFRVNWEGNGQDGNEYDEDMCLVTALDFIDMYNADTYRPQ